MTKYIIAILIILLIGVSVYFTQCRKEQHTFYITDTNTVTRLETKWKTDTVITWREKILWKEAKPEKIYVQKVDSIFIEKVKDLDVMLNVEKKGSNLHIFALNQNGKLLKESFYKVGNDFTASSATDRIVVKTKKFYFNPLSFYYTHYRPLSNLKEFTHSAGFLSEISYMNVCSLGAGFDYNIASKDISLKAEFKLNLFP